VRFDPDLLHVGAMFDDIGLVEGHRSEHDRFEVDGANAAREFLRRHGITGDALRVVWDAIALHTTPGIPEHKEPEVALVTAGVEYDVLGIDFDEISPEDRDAVLAAYRASTSRSRSSRRSPTGSRAGLPRRSGR
jgi:HD superfamily phosphodiesterase